MDSSERDDKFVRVLIVEDSDVVRLLLEDIINQDERLEVVGSVSCGEDAVKEIHRLRPDVISLDIRLPGIDGFETTYRIMSERPTPIVVVSASINDQDLNISMNALRAGALSVVEKPVGQNSDNYRDLAGRICNQLARMSQVKVITQRSQPVLHLNGKTDKPPAHRNAPAPAPDPKPSPAFPPTHLGIVASTGGPMALSTILAGLPADFPIPILVVQHITPAFLGGFVSWLNNLTALQVVTAEDGAWLNPGQVYVAPPDKHLEVRRGYAALIDGPLVNTQKPSGTVLFKSMADSLGRYAAGVLLTGMGEDGATGLKAIRDIGGYTLIEDASTAVVYGMPGTAARIGAATEELPLHQIKQRLIRLVQSPRDRVSLERRKDGKEQTSPCG